MERMCDFVSNVNVDLDLDELDVRRLVVGALARDWVAFLLRVGSR
eukprot:COSAG03_NODE_10263_length_661_cov_1.113879_1_plen_44_part_01